MIQVLLIHPGTIPHYRIPIYGYLSTYLKRYSFDLTVLSEGIHKDNPEPIEFPYIEVQLSLPRIVNTIRSRQIDVIIDFMGLRNLYLFPTYIMARGIMGKKMIYWGQGRNLLDANAKVRNIAYAAEQLMCSAIILYGEHLRKYVPKRFHKKTFVANNTLFINYNGFPGGMTRESVLGMYGIKTKKNIICIGRMQKRKRVDHLLKAFNDMNRTDIGLILAGPGEEAVLDKATGGNVFRLGPVYGDEKLHLLSSADVYCLPGAVGLSIVDAFYCGLPFVTEEGDESAEIMYLKDGINGFIVPRNDISALREKLLLLLDNDDLRTRFGAAAKREIEINGNINTFCSGFRKALFYAIGESDRD